MTFITRGFRGRRRVRSNKDRIPPGQYVTTDFPVLTAGPTPRFPAEVDWRLSLTDVNGSEREWTWAELTSLPRDTITVDIHCVTKWSKLDTKWSGVSVDTLLADVGARGTHAFFHSYGGYTTNLPLEDVTGGKAWIAFIYDGKPLDPEHGGPARLLVPHLYFWKSAKWVNKMVLYDFDRPGFWETLGYHNYGDPWLEQRYAGD
jgi:DMSO/TMAO reductase YedYZ molybdopterin-dependent catalytic subunit